MILHNSVYEERNSDLDNRKATLQATPRLATLEKHGPSLAPQARAQSKCDPQHLFLYGNSKKK
jgi:hypothetical protein